MYSALRGAFKYWLIKFTDFIKFKLACITCRIDYVRSVEALLNASKYVHQHMDPLIYIESYTFCIIEAKIRQACVRFYS